MGEDVQVKAAKEDAKEKTKKAADEKAECDKKVLEAKKADSVAEEQATAAVAKAKSDAESNVEDAKASAEAIAKKDGEEEVAAAETTASKAEDAAKGDEE